ncbi:hypothetical protein A2515_01540 [Candidatus Falkowbacteria bacterium RIFOXYD12_FULL_34_57]|nr:MAG: hypothetical protein A2500_05875 [Candidatus Falkowbacteria bacterium RIFOXYC12_FULL_34_55]OGF38705.1 MAG: hypothetical protein A2515_01540 [Candidatus Falkowbacteria bacterium RIFOXYD12_FULL_34_57]
MQPKAHLFVVDCDTMPIHIQKGFCGIVKINPTNRRGHSNVSFYGQLSDLMNISVGDLVYFYMQTKSTDRKFFQLQNQNDFEKLGQGYYGVFRVIDKPFISEREVRGEFPFDNFFIFGSRDNENYSNFQQEENRLPILSVRIPIEPINDYEDLRNKFVDDNQAYIDKTDEGQLSTLLFKKIKRKGEERSITPILPEEASKIARLIFKQERKNFPLNIGRNLVRKREDEENIKLTMSSRDRIVLDVEAMLEAYILNNLNNSLTLGPIDDVVGNYDEIEFCGNQVQYGISGNKVDILLLHRKNIAGNTNYRYRATVMELKKERIKLDDIEQIIDYQKWIAQLTTFNNLKAIQPILIGKRPSARMTTNTKAKIRENLNTIERIGISTPRFFEYSINFNNDQITDLNFQEFNINDLIQ